MKKRLLAAVLLGMVFAAGCGAAFTEEDLSQLHFVKYEEIEGDKTPEERAAAIKKRLAQLDGVTGTAVVVEGHTAIIALRTAGTEQTEETRVKQEAARAAREADPYIENTSITLNLRIVPLIEEMERRRAN